MNKVDSIQVDFSQISKDINRPLARQVETRSRVHCLAHCLAKIGSTQVDPLQNDLNEVVCKSLPKFPRPIKTKMGNVTPFNSTTSFRSKCTQVQKKNSN